MAPRKKPKCKQLLVRRIKLLGRTSKRGLAFFALLCGRSPLFVEVFWRKSNLIIPIDSPTVKGVIAEVFRILEFRENALVVDAGEVENAHVTIAEGKLQQVAGDILGSGNV